MRKFWCLFMVIVLIGLGAVATPSEVYSQSIIAKAPRTTQIQTYDYVGVMWCVVTYWDALTLCPDVENDWFFDYYGEDAMYVYFQAWGDPPPIDPCDPQPPTIPPCPPPPAPPRTAPWYLRFLTQPGINVIEPFSPPWNGIY